MTGLCGMEINSSTNPCLECYHYGLIMEQKPTNWKRVGIFLFTSVVVHFVAQCTWVKNLQVHSHSRNSNGKILVHPRVKY